MTWGKILLQRDYRESELDTLSYFKVLNYLFGLNEIYLFSTNFYFSSILSKNFSQWKCGLSFWRFVLYGWLIRTSHIPYVGRIGTKGHLHVIFSTNLILLHTILGTYSYNPNITNEDSDN